MNTPARGNLYFLLMLLYRLFLLELIGFLLHSLKLPIDPALLMGVHHLMLFMPPFLLYLFFTRQKASQVLPLEELNAVNLLFILLISLSVQPLMMFLSAVTSLFMENRAAGIVTDVSGAPFYVTLLVIALVPAVFEEIMMRGVVLTNYKQVNLKKAALINGLFFGILHLEPSQFLYAAVIGFIFTYFVRYTRSIYASVIGHLVINGCQVLLTFWSMSFESADPELAVEVSQLTFSDKLILLESIALIALIFLPTFILLMKSFIQYNKKRNVGVLFTEEVMAHLDQNPLVRPKIFGWAFWLAMAVYALLMAIFFLGAGPK